MKRAQHRCLGPGTADYRPGNLVVRYGITHLPFGAAQGEVRLKHPFPPLPRAASGRCFGRCFGTLRLGTTEEAQRSWKPKCYNEGDRFVICVQRASMEMPMGRAPSALNLSCRSNSASGWYAAASSVFSPRRDRTGGCAGSLIAIPRARAVRLPKGGATQVR